MSSKKCKEKNSYKIKEFRRRLKDYDFNWKDQKLKFKAYKRVFWEETKKWENCLKNS